jgi:Zn finger protein HypA/HybF involved in hydrogenase expression
MKRKWTDEQLIEAVKNSLSVREVLQKIGVIPAGGSYKVFHNAIKRLNLNTDHFTGQGHLKGKTHNWSPAIPLEDILIDGSITQSYKLKNKLLKENLIKNECDECGILEWQGQKLSLHLDHINGINTDNRLENLRLLCPNCHSLTDTYCGKNKRNNNLKMVAKVGLEPTSR